MEGIGAGAVVTLHACKGQYFTSKILSFAPVVGKVEIIANSAESIRDVDFAAAEERFAFTRADGHPWPLPPLQWGAKLLDRITGRNNQPPPSP